MVRSSRFFPNEELQLLFNAADVGVFPFADVLTSGSVITALSFGIPVIVPDIGCLPEVALPQAGIVYDHDDADGLRRAMLEIQEAGHPRLEASCQGACAGTGLGADSGTHSTGLSISIEKTGLGAWIPHSQLIWTTNMNPPAYHIQVSGLWKVFGSKPERALEPQHAGKSRDEIQEELGLVVGLRTSPSTCPRGRPSL